LYPKFSTNILWSSCHPHSCHLSPATNGINAFLVELSIVHEVIQHGCLQRLQPEVKEEDWDRNIPI